MPSAPSRWKLPEAKSDPLLPGNWEAVTTIPSFLLFLWGNGNENVGDWIERCTVVQILRTTRRGAAGTSVDLARRHQQPILDEETLKPTFLAPRSEFERKPPHGAPCNGCGMCCKALLCDLLALADEVIE